QHAVDLHERVVAIAWNRAIQVTLASLELRKLPVVTTAIGVADQEVEQSYLQVLSRIELVFHARFELFEQIRGIQYVRRSAEALALFAVFRPLLDCAEHVRELLTEFAQARIVRDVYESRTRDEQSDDFLQLGRDQASGWMQSCGLVLNYIADGRAF